MKEMDPFLATPCCVQLAVREEAHLPESQVGQEWDRRDEALCVAVFSDYSEEGACGFGTSGSDTM